MFTAFILAPTHVMLIGFFNYILNRNEVVKLSKYKTKSGTDQEWAVSCKYLDGRGGNFVEASGFFRPRKCLSNEKNLLNIILFIVIPIPSSYP